MPAGGIAGDGPVVLRELAAELPLSYLAGQLAAYDLAVDGTLQLAFERLELVQGMPRRATGYFELHDFRALEPLKLELGDFRGEVGTTGDELRLELRDLAGRLKLDGVAVLTPAGEYDISAELTPRRADDEELRRVIGFLGPPDKDGTVRVEFAGRLR
ncbi:MAG: type II secretion system protein N [Desulfurivibrio sp.]|nr:type II secretion system protein N [Desulfurivibrio sp.]